MKVDGDTLEYDHDSDEIIDRIYNVLSDPDSWQDLVVSFAEKYETLLTQSGSEDFQEISKTVQSRMGRLRPHFERFNSIFHSSSLDFMFADDHRREEEEHIPHLRVDASGRITEANQAAQSGFNIKVGEAIEAMPADADSLRALRSRLTQFSQGAAAEKQIAILPMYGLRGFPVIFSVTLAPRSGPGEPRSFLFRGLEIGWRDDVGQTVARVFQLTRAELEVFREIVQGRPIAEIASDRGRSPQTVRTQVRTLFDKTGLRSQIDIVRMYIAVSKFSQDQDIPGRLYTSNCRTEIIEVEPGRNIQVDIVGPDDGRPVLLFHGFITGGRFPLEVEQKLYAFGLKLITPFRPGYCRSTPADWTFEDYPDKIVQDAGAVLKHYGIERAVALGRFSGALYASAAVNAHKGILKGLIVVSGTPPTRTRRQLDAIKPEARIFAYSAKYFPQALPPLLWTFLQAVRKENARDFFDKWYSKPASDNRAAARSEVQKLLSSGWKNTLRHGTKAYMMDVRHTASDWSGFYTGLNKPILMIHGTQDPVSTLDQIEELVADFPKIRLETYEDAGQLLFFTHPDRLLKRIAEFFDEVSPSLARSQKP
ncbi:alpha/beta fold hydrolase [Roseibium aggregatum]|uniref:Alpha/beta fold hydrolase n=1 Tax=Roseibium aggregatum TaxID=187304 RepID=A0A939EIN0_9HYPH|nr:alpha/beta fold hydrolase [Roseibium aggregatum]MBN9672983.1 alpha/beta fold hydrolase [Roseibium aggregatum]